MIGGPGLRPVAIFDEVGRSHPEIDTGIRRTLERRIRTWRALHGVEQEVIFRQEHRRARLGGWLHARYRVAIRGRGEIHPAHQTPVAANPDAGLCEGNLDLLPEMPTAEKRQLQATAHEQIAQAVAATGAICNPYRAAESTNRHHKRRRTTRSR